MQCQTLHQKPLLVLALWERVLMYRNNESTIICAYIDHTFTIYSISCVALFTLACEASVGVGTVCTLIAIVCTSHTLINIYTRGVEIDRKSFTNVSGYGQFTQLYHVIIKQVFYNLVPFLTPSSKICKVKDN